MNKVLKEPQALGELSDLELVASWCDVGLAANVTSELQNKTKQPKQA